jgi:hypothetical protein
LPGLPLSLTTLNLQASTALTDLSDIPATNSGLTVNAPPEITLLSGLPATVETVDLSKSTKLATINLTNTIGRDTGLRYLTGIPPSCTSINLKGNPLLQSLIPPPDLVSLNITGCNFLTNLNFFGLSKLSSLVGIPATCTTLNVSGCSALTGLPQLPATLTRLQVENSGLTRIDLTRTNVATFDIPPAMIPQLTYLKLTGSKVQLSGLLNYEIPPGAQWFLY